MIPFYTFLLGLLLATPIAFLAGADWAGPQLPRATASWKQRRAWKAERLVIAVPNRRRA